MSSKKKSATVEVTMRDFRAAPAKILRRAARTGTKLRVDHFILSVEETDADKEGPLLHGAMSSSGRVVGDPSGLLSAEEEWST